MAASLAQIKKWVQEAKNAGDAYVVIVCDTWDHVDYPVPCRDASVCRQIVDEPGDMQRIMEVYDLGMDITAQLAESRAYHLPKVAPPEVAPPKVAPPEVAPPEVAPPKVA